MNKNKFESSQFDRCFTNCRNCHCLQVNYISSLHISEAKLSSRPNPSASSRAASLDLHAGTYKRRLIRLKGGVWKKWLHIYKARYGEARIFRSPFCGWQEAFRALTLRNDASYVMKWRAWKNIRAWETKRKRRSGLSGRIKSGGDEFFPTQIL